MTPTYPFDPSGTLASNKITGEQQIITVANFRDYHFVVPTLGPYFATSLKVVYKSLMNEVRVLEEGIDYYCTHWFISASRACSKPVYGSISFLNLQLAGVVTLEYQTLGGIWTIDQTAIANILGDHLHNPRTTAWDMVVDLPIAFPPVDHVWDLADMVGMTGLIASIGKVEAAILLNQTQGLSNHLLQPNPHKVTAAQVGAYTKAEVDQLFATHIQQSYSL